MLSYLIFPLSVLIITIIILSTKWGTANISEILYAKRIIT